MKNETSIEWLFKQLLDEPKDKLLWYAIFEKAKKIHKSEVCQFTCDFIDDGRDIPVEDYFDERL